MERAEPDVALGSGLNLLAESRDRRLGRQSSHYHRDIRVQQLRGDGRFDPGGDTAPDRFDTQTENRGPPICFLATRRTTRCSCGPCHAHYHFQNYMSYRLRYANGRLQPSVESGFCVLDVFRWDPNRHRPRSTIWQQPGNPKGLGDLYDSTLDGQWIDITACPTATHYRLEATPGITPGVGLFEQPHHRADLHGNPNAPPFER